MLHKSTQLRFLKADDPEILTLLVGALPFKVEYKEIKELKKELYFFFTVEDQYQKLSSEDIQAIAEANLG